MSANPINKLLVTGATGLVGSRFREFAKGDFSITTIGRTDADLTVDLLSQNEVKTVVENSDAEAVINFAAYTNVDKAEHEKDNKNGEVYTMNTLLPFWLAKACQLSGKKLYHISTDYVFNGKRGDRPYTEEDIPSPVGSWYSITKQLGEINVKGHSIIRISYPYSGLYERRLDVARTVVKRLSDNLPYAGITDQKIKPTSVDDISMALIFLLKNNLTGIFHVAGDFTPNEYITPFELANKLAKVFELDSSLIKQINFKEFSKDRMAPRPQHTWLSTKKIEALGFNITGIDAALTRFKQQLSNG